MISSLVSDRSAGSRDPRAAFVEAFFVRLNSTGTPYAVMNNYEDLPYLIPSDIDVTVPADFFARLDVFIIDFAERTGTLIVQKLWHGNQKCAFILGTSELGFLQLDFFVSFSTKSAPALLSHEELISGARTCNGFRVPSPDVELLFIVMRRLFKDDWDERHCARIAALKGQITGDAWLPQPYRWLGQTIEYAAAVDLQAVKARRVDDWKQLRRTARHRTGLRGLMKNAFNQASRLLHRLRDETGMIVVTEGHAISLDAEARKRIETLFHRHVQLNEASLKARSLMDRLRLPVELALLKRRKGLVFLSLHDRDARARRLLRSLAWMGEVDLTVSDPRLPSEWLVDTIARLQAEKTRRAMARGGTQTSSC